MKLNAVKLVSAAALAATAAAQSGIYQPNLLFNVTTDVISGLFKWGITEFSYNKSQGIYGWIPFYADMDNLIDFKVGWVGEGQGYRGVTSPWYNATAIPSFDFYFPGYGWQLDGYWRVWNASSSFKDIEVSAGGNPLTVNDPSRNLGTYSQMNWGYHDVGYNLRSDYVGGGNWTVENVTLMTGMVTNAPTFDEVPMTEDTFVVDGKLNPKFQYTGAWKVLTQLGGVGGQSPIPYNQAFANGSLTERATIDIKVPDNTSFMALWGTMGPDYDYWAVVYDPTPTLGQSPVSCYAWCVWNKPDALMTFQPLDPTVQYTIQVLLPANRTLGVGVSKISWYSGLYNGTGAAATVTSHIGEPTDGTRPTDISGGGSNNGTTGAQNGSGDKKKTNVGAIAGGVVGGVLGLALLLLLGFCLLRRRKSAKAVHPADNSRFEVDETANHTTPFLANAKAQRTGPPMVQTYNVDAQDGGFTTGRYSVADNSNAGYSSQDIGTPLAHNSSVPMATPLSASSGQPLLGAHLASMSDGDDSSSVSPSMSASAVGGGALGAYAAQGQTDTKSPIVTSTAPAVNEKRGSVPQTARTLPSPPGALGPHLASTTEPVTQEVDGGVAPAWNVVPPVYNPEWAPPNTTSTPTSGPSSSVSHTAPQSARLSVDSNADTSGFRTPREYPE